MGPHFCNGCWNNRYALKTLEIDDANCVLPLRKLCFKSLSKYSSLFAAEHLSYLPTEILEDFQWYLSVHDLLRYNAIFKQAGICATSVWEQHFLKRFGHTSLKKWYFKWTECHVSEENCHTFQAQFMLYHCSELLSSLWDTESDCKCVQNLCFYLRFTPSLIFRWRHSGEIRSIRIKQAIVENVQHLDVWGIKGTTFDYKEVTFLRSCKHLKSIYFRNFNLLSMFYGCERDCTNIMEESHNGKVSTFSENSVVSVKVNLGEDDINFLTSDKFSESEIKRLSILAYERTLSVCQLSGKSWFDTALRKLTHLTLTGEILAEPLVNELICSLFELFKNPVREPMKYLCLAFNGRMSFKFDFQQFSGQMYAVEEFEILQTEIEEVDTASVLFQFLQCNRSLCRLNFPETTVNLPRYSTDVLDTLLDVIVKSNLRVLTTPVVNGFGFDVYKILSNAPQINYLNVQGPGLIENIQSFQAVLISHRYIKTLSLQEIPLGERGTDLLTAVMTSETCHLSNLDLRFCEIHGEDLLTAAKTVSKSRVKHKLHLLDISMNKINRQQQTTIKMLYKTLTDILIVDIPDRPQMEYVAQM